MKRLLALTLTACALAGVAQAAPRPLTPVPEGAEIDFTLKVDVRSGDRVVSPLFPRPRR
jgi:hypothetical protein